MSVLSSNFVTGDRAVQVFEKLFRSTMYRRDQRTFMLYPDRQLKGFMDKNVVPVEQVDCWAHVLRRPRATGHEGVLPRGPGMDIIVTEFWWGWGWGGGEGGSKGPEMTKSQLRNSSVPLVVKGTFWR